MVKMDLIQSLRTKSQSLNSCSDLVSIIRDIWSQLDGIERRRINNILKRD